MSHVLHRSHVTTTLGLALAVGCSLAGGARNSKAASSQPSAKVEEWGRFEVVLTGPQTGNPFVDVVLLARFFQDFESIVVPGFYDGNCTYRIRFMPPKKGLWKFRTESNAADLDGKIGEVMAIAPSRGNHGPVRVAHTYHFAYADGTPYKQIGTTAYAWTWQGEALAAKTLKTLAESPFNKVRFCVFPKHYSWNQNEPPLYPFEGTPRNWDTRRFNPAYFQHLEKHIDHLQKLGIEADIILLHPYDKGTWGFDQMSSIEDDRYLRYVVSRLAAFRNVWWSLANEYDYMAAKTEDDWERMGQLVSQSDPYKHLLSIHNGRNLFNHTRPWITHVSIQSGTAVEDMRAAGIFRDVYRKPVVYDEVRYEGNIPRWFGNLKPEELVLRFWVGTVAGTYVGHGETYLSPDDILWWSKGGVLKGQSPARLAFLKKVLKDSPATGINPVDQRFLEYGGKAGEYYLVYFGKEQPTSWEFKLPKVGKDNGPELDETMKFQIEVLDTWNMTITPVPGVFRPIKKDDYLFGEKNGRAVSLPGMPFMALRIKRISPPRVVYSNPFPPSSSAGRTLKSNPFPNPSAGK
jgi:hypothetical protein